MTLTLVPVHENQEWKQGLAETFNLNNAYKCSCLAVSLYAIWHNKNIYFHEGIRQRTCEIVASIKAYLADLDKLKEALKFSGIIIRNYTELVIGLCSYLIHNVRDLTIAEAYACLKGAVFAEEIGFSDVIMEGDSRIVIKKLQNHGNDRSAIRGVINKIIVMSRIFWNIEFQFIPREANGLAYAMAAWGRG
ncbi:hypothetical protein Gohar_013059, partial [Gossypium harknessii]|nr:hypothetical protein [Gossypium harknessii]